MICNINTEEINYRFLRIASRICMFQENYWMERYTLLVTAFTGGMVGVYKGLRGAIFGSEVEDV